MLPDLSVIVVSFNTKGLTLRALETLYEHTEDMDLQVIVLDNASTDGSSDAISEQFPQVDLIRSPENLGFGAGNNRAAEHAKSDWILLLNSDTEVRSGAIQNVLSMAKKNPQAGIVGGRTLFGDGTPNPTSCCNRMTVWSLFCYSTGIFRLFAGISALDPERIHWNMMENERHVDIVSGCFLLLSAELWRKLDGFDERYFMYAEEWDLCIRAGKLGYKPMMTPEATIVHHGGASAASTGKRQVQSYRGKATIVRDHFGPIRKEMGLGLLWLVALSRHLGHSILAKLGVPRESKAAMWRDVWDQRANWLKGY